MLQEVCTLILAVEWKGDKLTELNVIGLLFCVGGIICHIVNKTVNSARTHPPTPLHKPLLDQASAHFLAEESTDEDDERRDEDSSTEVLFSVLNSRSR